MNATIGNEIQEQQNHGRQKYGNGPDDFAHDDRHTEEEWCEFIDGHCQRARHETPHEFRQRMIKIAGLAVSAVESFDRKRVWP